MILIFIVSGVDVDRLGLMQADQDNNNNKNNRVRAVHPIDFAYKYVKTSTQSFYFGLNEFKIKFCHSVHVKIVYIHVYYSYH